MVAVINLPIPSAMGLPITLARNTINLPVVISIYIPLTISSGPWSRPRREGGYSNSELRFFSENTELRAEPFPGPHTVSG